MLIRRPSSISPLRSALLIGATGLTLLGTAGAAGAADSPTPAATAASSSSSASTAEEPTGTATPSATASPSATKASEPAKAPADAPTGAPDTGFGDSASSTSIPLVAVGAVALLGAVAVPLVAAQRRRGQF